MTDIACSTPINFGNLTNVEVHYKQTTCGSHLSSPVN